MRHGKGVYKFSNGRVYEGSFFKNFFEGKGKFSWETGDQFTGEFEKGNLGKGNVNYSIGIKGTGDFSKEIDKNIYYTVDRESLEKEVLGDYLEELEKQKMDQN